MAVTFRRDLYGPDHEAFRDTVRAFLAKEVAPHHQSWERNGVVDREVWYSAGRQGLLGPAVDQEYGGGGSDDFRYNAVLIEEFARAGASGLALSLHNDIVGPYLTRLATEEQKRRWLPGFVSGDIVTAIAMTEPGAGSDLQGIRTTATDRGDHYLLNGSKTFISNGILADLVVVVARTTPEGGSAGQSLLVVERGADGFERGRNLAKIGQQAQDTAELFFNDVRVPKENLLGEENRAFTYLMGNLAQERLAIAVGAAAATEEILDITTRYVKEREAFGLPLAKLQHVRFEIAEMATEAAVTRTFLDRCVTEHVAGLLRSRARLDGQVVGHRTPEAGRRPLSATARRLRLHERVPGGAGVPRRAHPDHLRRHHRDHEGDHRPLPPGLSRRPSPPLPAPRRGPPHTHWEDPRGEHRSVRVRRDPHPARTRQGERRPARHEARRPGRRSHPGDPRPVPRLDPAAVDDIVLGVVGPVGDQGSDIARIAAIAAGLPDTVAGVQENRFCASGLEAVNMAAMKVRSGWEDWSSRAASSPCPASRWPRTAAPGSTTR